jgi:hypothetical protein
MERVFSVEDMPWADLKGLPGARGFEFKSLTDRTYTTAYSCNSFGLIRAITPFRISSRGVTCSIF